MRDNDPEMDRGDIKDAPQVGFAIQPFIDAGLVPHNCVRLIIDVRAGDSVRIYYEIFANHKALDVLDILLTKGGTFPKGQPL